MTRALLVLMSLLLLLGLPSDVVSEASESPVAAVAEADDCHCCPADESASDCCDWDFGACHGTSMVATPPSSPLPVAERAARLESRASIPVHLLRPRDNGPPPTPPPIA